MGHTSPGWQPSRTVSVILAGAQRNEVADPHRGIRATDENHVTPRESSIENQQKPERTAVLIDSSAPLRSARNDSVGRVRSE